MMYLPPSPQSYITITRDQAFALAMHLLEAYRNPPKEPIHCETDNGVTLDIEIEEGELCATCHDTGVTANGKFVCGKCLGLYGKTLKMRPAAYELCRKAGIVEESKEKSNATTEKP